MHACMHACCERLTLPWQSPVSSPASAGNMFTFWHTASERLGYLTSLERAFEYP